MKAVAYFEVDVPQCSLTYSVAPCTASLTASPPTGTIKCFNSLGTCQDRANFTDVPVTLRFAEDVGILPSEIAAFPFIEKIDFTPAIVSLAGDLGQRATLKVVFKNARHSDAGPIFDKYSADRDYDDPWSQGTFWGKFRARNPFLRSRPCRLIRGLVPDEIDDSYDQGDPLPDVLDEQETRHFIIESINGPTAKGEFSIIAKDVLKLADGDRAQAPVLSNGFLNADINAVVTSAVLAPTGIGNAEYGAEGYATIGGNEIVIFSRSGDTLTLGRGQLNTVAVEHKAGDRVQVLLWHIAADGADILYDLWDRAGADPDWLPLADWQTETAAFLNVVYTLYVTEPTPIAKLIAEVLEYMGAAQWWDDLNQKIRLRVLRSISTEAQRYNEDNVLEQALEVVEQPDKRVSRVIVYFGQINPVKKIDDLENYRSTALVVDEDSEEDEGTSAIKTIFARGIAAVGGRAVAEIIGQKYLSRYVQPPRRFSFELMQYAGVTPSLGGGYRLGGGTPLIESWPFEDETGARVDCPMQVTRVHPEGKIEAEEMLFTAFGGDIDPTDRVIVFDFNTTNINLRTVHDQVYDDASSGDTITVYISSGVIIGSTSTALIAFDVGSWPSGVTIVINIAGRIEGAGGAGGNAPAAGGPSAPGINGVAGLPGGTAFYTRYAVSVVQSSSQIWSGGGGGGSGVSYISSGGGGGGGGGYYQGLGGGGGGGLVPGGTGASGTTEAGGAGGTATNFPGGAGGNPGSAGATGTGYIALSLIGGAGGAAGTAIDGVSFVSLSGSGSILGSQVN